jgi:crotonobetainyl-CoA:carnitine CoA-transferase CaiB-like acyl-CoA transferase
LAQLGADVIKIESPRHGDGNRENDPKFHGNWILHYALNAGTRSLAVDARSEAWPAVIQAVSKWADIVIVGNRPSSAQRLGIDPASLLQHNPNLVYCLVSGYGLDGPWSDYPAHGLNMDALAGTIPLENHEGRPVAPTSYRSFGPTVAGMEAALAAMTALHRRDQGFGPQFVHISVWEAAVSWMWRDIVSQANLGHQWDQYRDLGPRYSMYWTSEGGAILVCPIEQHFWQRFCDVIGLPPSARSRGDWSQGADYGRSYTGEYEEIQERMRTRRRDEWEKLLSEADVPVAPILNWRETMESEHAVANGLLANYTYDGVEVHVPTTPASITPLGDRDSIDFESLAASHRNKGSKLTPAPDLGQHNAEILAELGLGSQFELTSTPLKEDDK